MPTSSTIPKGIHWKHYFILVRAYQDLTPGSRVLEASRLLAESSKSAFLK